MDFMDSFGVSSRGFKLIYYGNLLFWIILAMCLVIFFILELTIDDAQSSMPDMPLTTEPFQLPDMGNILMWGFNGQGVKVNISKLYPGHQEEYKNGYTKYHLNKYLSDRISMRRPLSDVRSQECKQTSLHLKSLPSVSVVVVFRNEPRTTLLRMLYSIIDRSPERQLHSIILVDDGSNVEDLQFPKLEHYVSVLTKVSIIRLPTYQGLAQARMIGAQRASGEVIIFLQPRCECTEGWMAPLLECIAADHNTIAVPVVDRIDYDTFQYSHDTLSEMKVGSFSWSLSIQKKFMAKPVDAGAMNIPNPVIADGIFAVARDKLLQLGGFDEGLLAEDSVNIEFSFRSWMCGGRVVLVPCSHVGFLALLAPMEGPEILDIQTIGDNLRIADALMGSYKYFVYERMRLAARTVKHQLNSLAFQRKISGPQVPGICQNFDWYLQEVEPAMLFTREISRRGQIFLLGTENRVVSLGVWDGDLVLQDYTSSLVTFWYHLKSGSLVTENKTCLSYQPDNMKTEETLSVPSSMELDNNFYSDQTRLPKKMLQMNEASAKRQNQGQLDSTIHPRVSFENQLITNKLLFNPEHESFRNELGYIRKLHLKRRQQYKNNPQFEESQQVHFESLSDIDTNSYETQIRKRSILNIIDHKLDVTEPKLKSPSSNKKLDEQDQTRNTHKPIGQPISNIVMKQCEDKTDGDQWIYTKDQHHSTLDNPMHTQFFSASISPAYTDLSCPTYLAQALQHVQSGLCMEAQEGIFGKYLLNLVQCDRNSWAQQWKFTSA